MKTYKVTLTFTDPYIGSRNGGDKTLSTGLSLKDAKKALLTIFNDKSDFYATSWTEAKRKTEKRIDRAFGKNSDSAFYFDSRIYKIEAE